MRRTHVAMHDDALCRLPHLGAGLSHRRELNPALLHESPPVDFLEIIADKYMDPSREALDSLEKLAEKYALVPHGLGLSVATAGRISGRMLQSIRQVCRLTQAAYYSDHLAVTEVPGIDIRHLAPTLYDRAALMRVISNVNQVQDALGIPFVIENITETHAIGGGEFEVPDFMERLVEATGCGLLLDITNLYTNCVNAGRDPLEFALRMPLRTVVQVHLAGGKWQAGKLLDTHCQSVPRQVWELFGMLAPHLTRLKGAIIERDGDFPEFSSLVKEVCQARQIMAESAPSVARG